MTQKRSVQRLDTLRRALLAQRAQGCPWRRISQDYPGVPAGTLCAIAKGREPKKAAVRLALGLPALQPTPVCPVHGVVHTGRCPRPHPSPKSLWDWPVRELARALRERVTL